MFSERGIVVCGYQDETGSPFEALARPEKFAESRKSIERLHPGHGKELEKPMIVEWGKIQYNEGSWLRRFSPDQKAPGVSLTKQTGQAMHPSSARTKTDPAYQQMILPDGPILFAGDHCSHVVAWQEGAALSALYAVNQLVDKVKMAKLASAPAIVG
jgi:monoamine oxidase